MRRTCQQKHACLGAFARDTVLSTCRAGSKPVEGVSHTAADLGEGYLHIQPPRRPHYHGGRRRRTRAATPRHATHATMSRSRRHWDTTASRTPSARDQINATLTPHEDHRLQRSAARSPRGYAGPRRMEEPCCRRSSALRRQRGEDGREEKRGRRLGR